MVVSPSVVTPKWVPGSFLPSLLPILFSQHESILSSHLSLSLYKRQTVSQH